MSLWSDHPAEPFEHGVASSGVVVDTLNQALACILSTVGKFAVDLRDG